MYPEKSNVVVIYTVVLFIDLVLGESCETPSRLCEDNTIEYCNDYESLSLSDYCFKNKTCDPENKYYAYDGSCNNLKFSMWGQANNGFLRRLKADYSDGYKSFKTAQNGDQLPYTRNLANIIFPTEEYLDDKWTVHFYSFGQWLTHDIAAFNAPPASRPCCVNSTPSENMAEECMPLIIYKNDPFYSKFNVTCMERPRALSTETIGCNITPIFQINQATAYIDMSMLYSSNETVANSIREFQGGRLKTIRNEKMLEFPAIRNSCPLGGLEPVRKGRCMLTGDDRHNQNPEITVLLLVFLRVHNYIAGKLSEINPFASDEILFQETRRILIAFYQHVVYKEFLPILLGPDFMKKYDLYPLKKGYAVGYDDSINAGIESHYETAAGRFLHSMVLGKVNYKDENDYETSYLLRDHYFNQSFITKGDTLKNLNIAYAESACEKQDRYESEEIRNYLFKTVRSTPYGSDLIGIDMLRCRDFGTRSWNDVRRACSLPTATNFDDLKKYLFSDKIVEKIKQLYNSVDDMDYYTGGLLEKQLPGSVSGPSAVCIAGDTYYTLKYGDRLHYQFETAQFTLEQLDVIRKTASYVWFLCISNPELETIQKNPFKLPSKNNPSICCKDIIADINIFISWVL